MLAWFALYLSAAVASPLMASSGFAVICSADGIARLVQSGDAGGSGDARAALHCPLCVPAGAPPPPARHGVEMPLQPLAYALRPAPPCWPAAFTTAPPSARGPPASA